MGAVLGLVFGMGALLVVLGLSGPPRPVRGRRVRRGAAARAAQAAVAALTAAAVVLVLTAVPVAALLAGTAAAALPGLLRRRSELLRLRQQRAAWPDAIDGFLAAVRAGVPLAEAIAGSATDGPKPLREGFAVYAGVWRRGGSLREALLAMQRYFADPAADRVVAALALAAEAGGDNVGRVLATQGDFLRSDLRMRGEIDAKQSWTVTAARVAVAAPWLAVAAVSVRTESARAYATLPGGIVLLTTAAVCVGAYWAMTRIAALPASARLPELRP